MSTPWKKGVIYFPLRGKEKSDRGGRDGNARGGCPLERGKGASEKKGFSRGKERSTCAGGSQRRRCRGGKGSTFEGEKRYLTPVTQRGKKGMLDTTRKDGDRREGAVSVSRHPEPETLPRSQNSPGRRTTDSPREKRSQPGGNHPFVGTTKKKNTGSIPWASKKSKKKKREYTPNNHPSWRKKGWRWLRPNCPRKRMAFGGENPHSPP